MTGKVAALFAPIIKAAKLAAWPVGSIYMSMVATNPGTLFGGTWERIAYGRMLIGADSASYPVGSTGGEAEKSFALSSTSYAKIVLAGSSGGIIGDFISAKWAYSRKYAASLDSTGGNALYGSPLVGSTEKSSIMPPYLSVYMWRRTA